MTFPFLVPDKDKGGSRGKKYDRGECSCNNDLNFSISGDWEMFDIFLSGRPGQEEKGGKISPEVHVWGVPCLPSEEEVH